MEQAPARKEPTRAEVKAAKQAARSNELQQLMIDLNRLLEEHDAALDVCCKRGRKGRWYQLTHAALSADLVQQEGPAAAEAAGGGVAAVQQEAPVAAVEAAAPSN